MSKYVNDAGMQRAFGTNVLDFNGDFLHPNEIINKTYNEIFDPMELSVELDDHFKKAFCKRFWNSNIGGTGTFGGFFPILEDCLDSDCHNLLYFYNFLRYPSEEDLLTTIDLENDGDQDGTSAGLQIMQNTPKNDLNIIYDDSDTDNRIIRYASALQEQHSRQNAKNKTKTKG